MGLEGAAGSGWRPISTAGRMDRLIATVQPRIGVVRAIFRAAFGRGSFGA